MKRVYVGIDNYVNSTQFDKWIMSAVGIKKTFQEVDTYLTLKAVYQFQEIEIEYEESGSHRDGAEVAITVRGCQHAKKLLEDICLSIEKNFSRMKKLNLKQD